MDAPEEDIATPQHRYELRPSRERNYLHRLAHEMNSQTDPKSYTKGKQFLQSRVENTLTVFVLTQMSASKGIKLFGKPAIDAILMEFCQLHGMEVFDPMMASTLTGAQRKAALRAVNLVKEKKSGKLKGRTCVDGSTQRSMYEKSETSSPTVSTDSLMYSAIIDAKEGRDVATADVVGAYLNADMDRFTLMKLMGEAVTIMLDVCDSYQKYVTQENGKPVLYLRLKKALYGCVRSVLL
jgi:hypothetical protein